MNSRQRRKFKRMWPFVFNYNHLYSRKDVFEYMAKIDEYLEENNIQHFYKDSTIYFSNEKEYMVFLLKWS